MSKRMAFSMLWEGPTISWLMSIREKKMINDKVRGSVCTASELQNGLGCLDFASISYIFGGFRWNLKRFQTRKQGARSQSISFCQ